MAIIEEGNPASAAAGQIPPGAGGGAAEPQAAEPTAAEPVAAEPAAAEPAPEPAPEPTPEPEAPQFAQADAFGWEDWDGGAEGLPEEVRGWHEKFKGRHDLTMQGMASKEDLDRAVAEAAQWKGYYESVFSGEEDPRIAEHLEKAAVAEHMLKQQKEDFAAQKAAYTELLKKDSDRYMTWVESQYSDVLKTLTSENGDQIEGLMDLDMELHDILEVFKSGPEAMAEAEKLRKANTDSAIVMRIIASEFNPKAKAAAAEAAAPVPVPSPASQVVSGADGTGGKRATAPPAPAKPTGRLASIQAAAAKAAKAHKH